MRFVRAIWKLLVGIKDALVLVFMLLFFGLLYAGLSAQPKPVGEGVLLVDLDGTVVEQPATARRDRVAGGPGRPPARISRCATWSRRSTRRATTTASRRSRSTSTASSAAARRRWATWARRSRRVRASGKPVLAYATGYTDDGYQLAADASEIWLNPLGAVVARRAGRAEPLLQGPARQAGRDRQRLSRRHLQVGGRALHPQRHVARSQGDGAGAWRRLARNLARGRARARPAAAIDAYMRDTAAWSQRPAATWPRRRWPPSWSTRSATGAAFEARLAELGGKDEDAKGGYQRIKLDSFIEDAVDTNPARADRHRHGRRRHRRRQGAGRDGGRRQHRRSDRKRPSRRQAEGAGRARRQPGRVGHRVRADPPGDARRQGRRNCRSSCRWAMSPHRAAIGSRRPAISSSPSRRPSPARSACSASCRASRARLTKLGLGADGVKTTPLSGEPDLLQRPLARGRPADPGRRRTASTATSSASSPSRARKTPAEIDRIAQGRVWDGGTARQLGLVDGFGGMDEAIAKAAELAKLGDERGVRYLERPRSFEREIARDARRRR